MGGKLHESVLVISPTLYSWDSNQLVRRRWRCDFRSLIFLRSEPFRWIWFCGYDSRCCEFEQRPIMNRLLLLLICGNFSLAGKFHVHVFMMDFVSFSRFWSRNSEREKGKVFLMIAAAFWLWLFFWLATVH